MLVARHLQVSSTLHLLPLTRPTSSCRDPECEDSLHGQCVPTGVTAEEPKVDIMIAATMSLSSMFYRMSYILQYISLPSFLLPDQTTTPTAHRPVVTTPAGPPCQSPTYKERGGVCLLPWQPRPEGFQHSGLMIFNLENREN